MGSIWGLVGLWTGLGAGVKEGKKDVVYGRSRFEPGELGLLRSTFNTHCEMASQVTKDGESVILANRVLPILRVIQLAGSGYQDLSEKDLKYVINEAGLNGREWLNFDEFLEVCGGLKEVVGVQPVGGTGKERKRTRIPVEKSGGGV